MNSESKQKRIAYGYYRDIDDRIRIHEHYAAYVKLIFIYRSYGESLGSIKKKLETVGVLSPQGGKAWSCQTLQNILSNPHYMGDDDYPQIITPEQFKEVQIIHG